MRAMLQTLRRWWGTAEQVTDPAGKSDLPLERPRARLFSVEQMKRHGRALAGTHALRPGHHTDQLLARLDDNQKAIARTYARLNQAAQLGRGMTPADDWLLDNMYLIEEQVGIARRHLPKGYSSELPVLGEGVNAGFPRVYDIAFNAIAHGDGQVDAHGLSSFVSAYQSVTPLTLGELWAIPIMLRLALIENLRRLCQPLSGDRRDRDLADLWADRMIATAESDLKDLVLVVADMARDEPPARSAFIAEFVRRLQGHSAALTLPLTWVEQWLDAEEQTVEQIVAAENRHQATMQVSISNSINSLRFLATMDWREFVETMSVVEQALRQDPPGIYSGMDFATRDHYRHVTERIAKLGRIAEHKVAETVLRLAVQRADIAGKDDLAAHVGYYLIEDGRRELEQTLGLRGVGRSIRSTASRLPLLAYIVPVIAIIVVCTAGLLQHPLLAAVPNWMSWLAAALAVLAFSDLAVSVVNWAATVLVRPNLLPRMDYSSGLPAQARTLVVVPSLLGSAEDARTLAEALEVRYLANRDERLHFALLTDFLDAPQQTLPGDDALLDAAQQCIDVLNTEYAPDSQDRFFLFHRPRSWNPAEGVWMGHERKRGKLAAINAFIRGQDSSIFSRIVGDTTQLGNVRYVITLDSDTQLPRDAARELVGAMAHPLNRPRFDEKRRVVTRGYGILQPRVDVSMSGQRRSHYAGIYGSEAGIDPYTREVSDVYQDLFGEGSFVGKGIYDVDAFTHALERRLPENRILSHDLLEGCYARAGLISDVQLYEDYPGDYLVDVKRRRRWIRGDWQLLPWLLPWVPLPRGDSPARAWERNPLSLLSRGKILDNLRRSLVPLAYLGALLIGWMLAVNPLTWTLWLLAIVLLLPAISSIREALVRPPDLGMSAHLQHSTRSAGRSFGNAVLKLVTLPHEAWFSTDAIVRTLWRLVRGRRLLQWQPSSQVARNLGNSLTGTLLAMLPAPAFAAITGVLLAQLRPQALPIALPLLLLWAASPLVMWWLSRPRARPRVTLVPEQQLFLGRLARRTWSFFERYVGADQHHLPPDNVQEHPSLVVAQRTSPTNIGLSLLADLAAYDFGYLSLGAMLPRTAGTLRTLEALPRFRGHPYNWYDTQTLEPLAPRYVSCVDSGNLAGHLLTLRQGLLQLREAPVISDCLFRGLVDTLGVLIQTMRDATHERTPSEQAALTTSAQLRQRLTTLCRSPPYQARGWAAAVLELQAQADALAENLAEAPDEIRYWANALATQCAQARAELALLAPWLLEHPQPNDEKTQSAQAQAQPSDSTLSEQVASAPATLGVGMPTLAQIAALELTDAAQMWQAAIRAARERRAELERLAQQAWRQAQMDFNFLYDPSRHLFAIGYNVDDQRMDAGYYDLLASEARLGCFIAIAQAQVPQESWFALGRQLTEVNGMPALLSWSGSMFEYLMPQLVMPSYEGSLLEDTAENVVLAQITYARKRDVPWGISESGYNLVDARMNYQYRAFGVPGLGLKRGLGDDVVIAPYASAMALMVKPQAACQNLQRMAELGFGGRMGMYEAIDFTSARMPRGQNHVVVQSFMSHHQGMTLLSLLHLLRNQPMQQRFAADPELQATLLLLQERVPHTATFQPRPDEAPAPAQTAAANAGSARIFTTPNTERPALQLLSNGRYHLMLSAAGGGYSRLGDLALTRWREDGTRDCWGCFCYLRDVDSGEFCSTAYQPTCIAVDHYEAILSDAKVEFRGRKFGLDLHTEIAVTPEDDVELRRLRLFNRDRTARTIEITTYAEVVLAPGISDESHPAFGNLFVQTELMRDLQAIVCTRRSRDADQTAPSMCHLIAVHGATIDAISYETDRASFLGRGNTPAAPAALTSQEQLSNSAGSVLDPVLAIRARITLQPGQSAIVDMVWGVGHDRAACDGLIHKYRDRRLADRVFDLAWTHSQVMRRQINASEADTQLYERLAGPLLYAHPALRAEQTVLLQNRRGQSGLWPHAISGDHPIVLLRISDPERIDLVRQLLQAHAYWRLKGMIVELLIWNEDHGGYRQQLQDQIMGLVGASIDNALIDRPGGVFVRAAHQLAQEDRILMQSVARVILSDAAGSLGQQIRGRTITPADLPPSLPLPLPLPFPSPAVTNSNGSADEDSSAPLAARAPSALPVPPQLASGAFVADGREYQITLTPGTMTPMPWSNVLANAHFGCVVSESTPGYTWFENAHEFRLTPWHNDAISDTCGEAFYLRDEEDGQFWSPTPLPVRANSQYQVRHGYGYTVYTCEHAGIASELWLYVDRDRPLKYAVLKLHNRSGRLRRLAATGYVEWILGELGSRTRMHVISEVDGDSNVLIARNPYHVEFGGHAAFFDAQPPQPGHHARSLTADRGEFIGRNGSLQAPEAMRRESLSGRLGAGLDPCAAIQIPLDLDVNETQQVVFRLGLGRNWGEAVTLAEETRGDEACARALDDVRNHWNRVLSTVRIRTPEPAIDTLANGWLLYQTIACRFLARSGYYQSGGAFGFRDQLQDAMAILHAQPEQVREHLLRCAQHQFPEGDVLHWWHPPHDRGVRTRCSDDYLWLPLVTARYVAVTGDASVLDKHANYIEGRPVGSDEESYYDLPTRSVLRESLYWHCKRAVQRGLRLRGERGLPLIGTGDWNDGMNRVGEHGRGESVWLGWFLLDVLRQFAPAARLAGDHVFAEHCLEQAEVLRGNLERHAWDGAWYRRAWFDDGTALGSSTSSECQIDSISQSWAVLSGAGDPERVRNALASLETRLVRRDAGLIQLLDPPFDRAEPDPGYIRGYVPGVRENGGQYTHAAIWATMAYALHGEHDKAWDLLRMITPSQHTEHDAAIATYKVEPYVVAADVYAVKPHIGRGGWTWYTGSAGWMYRLVVETLLGLQREGDVLRIQPRVPQGWQGYAIEYGFGASRYQIQMQRDPALAAGTTSVVLDGDALDQIGIPLRDDGADHAVEIRFN